VSGDIVRTFDAAAEMYDRFVGRYAPALALAHLEALGVGPGDRVLDVGCGPGAFARAAADIVGSERVTALDPSPSFVEACRTRVPGADVRLGVAEDLVPPPVPFDVASSQLVVNFMTDAERGVRAMAAATRPGGVVGSVVWDYKGEMTMLRTFWDAAVALDPDALDEGRTMRYGTPEELQELWDASGLQDVTTRPLVVEAAYESFDDFWTPFLAGVGPAGAYCAALEPDAQHALRDECFKRLGSPAGPFTLSARAWLVRGTSTS
jgi:SAM-dependent methyltransferase